VTLTKFFLDTVKDLQDIQNASSGSQLLIDTKGRKKHADKKQEDPLIMK
jgi:hypothetical protein